MQIMAMPPAKKKQTDSGCKPYPVIRRELGGNERPCKRSERMCQEWEKEILRSEQFHAFTQSRHVGYISAHWERNDKLPDLEEPHVDETAADNSRQHDQNALQD